MLQAPCPLLSPLRLVNFLPLTPHGIFDRVVIFCYDAVNLRFPLTTFSLDLDPGRLGVKGSRKAAKIAKKKEMKQRGKIIKDFFTPDI
jgi:hypothetical protein